MSTCDKVNRNKRCSLSFRSEFFAIFKISPEIIFSEGKFDEELVDITGELVRAITIELAPIFGQNCSQRIQKSRNDKFGENKYSHIHTNLFSIRLAYRRCHEKSSYVSNFASSFYCMNGSIEGRYTKAPMCRILRHHFIA